MCERRVKILQRQCSTSQSSMAHIRMLICATECEKESSAFLTILPCQSNDAEPCLVVMTTRLILETTTLTRVKAGSLTHLYEWVSVRSGMCLCTVRIPVARGKIKKALQWVCVFWCECWNGGNRVVSKGFHYELKTLPPLTISVYLPSAIWETDAKEGCSLGFCANGQLEDLDRLMSQIYSYYRTYLFMGS